MMVLQFDSECKTRLLTMLQKMQLNNTIPCRFASLDGLLCGMPKTRRASGYAETRALTHVALVLRHADRSAGHQCEYL